MSFEIRLSIAKDDSKIDPTFKNNGKILHDKVFKVFNPKSRTLYIRELSFLIKDQTGKEEKRGFHRIESYFKNIQTDVNFLNIEYNSQREIEEYNKSHYNDKRTYYKPEYLKKFENEFQKIFAEFKQKGYRTEQWEVNDFLRGILKELRFINPSLNEKGEKKEIKPVKPTYLTATNIKPEEKPNIFVRKEYPITKKVTPVVIRKTNVPEKNKTTSIKKIINTTNIDLLYKDAKKNKNNDMLFIRCREIVSEIINIIIQSDNRIMNKEYLLSKTPGEKLNEVIFCSLIPDKILTLFKEVIFTGNKAAHELPKKELKEKRSRILKITEELISWFKFSY